MDTSSRPLAFSLAALLAAVLAASARPARSEEPAPPAAAPPAQPAPAAEGTAAAPATDPGTAQAATPAAPPPGAPLPAASGPGAAAPEHDAAGEEIVVTATRRPQRIRDVPAAVTLVQREEIERSPTKTADELLRVDPSFNLFRRSSSVGADPSSQGVKLRNVGGTATSRALVLVDGIPENDAFGGWVAWRSIPRLALSRIEVVPGGGSALYGNYALGGVIQAFSRPIQPREGELSAEAGSFGTAIVAGHATDVWGPVGAALDGEWLRSDGYDVAAECPPLTNPSGAPEQCRGPIDRPTASEHVAVRGRVGVDASPHLSFDLRGGYFWEDLNAGTQFTTASMRRAELAAGAHYLADEAGAVDLTLFGHTGEFFQERARPATGRVSEVLAGHQNVPTDDLGASLVWQSRPLELAGTHALMVGADARWVRGTSYERSFPPGSPPGASSTIERDAGGRQRLYGVFAQDVWEVTRAFGGSLALRYDRWDNVAGSTVVTTYDGTVTRQEFPDRSGDVLSPKVGLHGRIAEWLSVRAAAYRSFRGPTLDELYRSFQVGTIVTYGNPDLTPEKLRGAEAGVDLGTPHGPSLRLTGFWNEIDDPIVNATNSDGTSRQKQNLGKARIQGLETDAAWPFARRWSANVAYTLAASRVTEAPNQPALVGNQLAQAPKHLATASLSFDDPRLLAASAQLRYLGDQYEDDQNQRPLGDALLVDLFAAWHATRRLDVFLAVENLLDKTYYVGRAGLDTIGQPRFVHGGIRIQGGG